MSRFVIRNQVGLLHTYNKVDGNKWVPDPADPSRNNQIPLLVPLFETVTPLTALKFETYADAQAAFANPDLKDPAAFAGCQIFEAEHHPEDPHAVKPAA